MAIGAALPKPSTLYMTYDGVLEPLGESQVVAYLEKLADAYAIHLISFEKPGDLAERDRLARMTTRLSIAGIVWHPRRYHKHPKILSTLWDMAAAMLLAVWLTLRHRVCLLHARSILCAAMLYPAKLIGSARFLVDIRGFWADERVDGGMIPSGGPVYRVLKAIEKTMLVRADHVVTLTRASVPVLREDPRFGLTAAPISVIPTCTDLNLFAPASSDGAPLVPRPLTIGYVGQVGTWYMLDEMLAFFVAVRRLQPDARMLIVNKNQQDEIRRLVERVGVNPGAVEIVASNRADMPTYIGRMDAGLALIHPFFSKIASAPTKLAEYLGCGVPVVGNAGCGDMVQIIEEDGVGVAMADTSASAIEGAAVELIARLADPALPARCVASAHRHFALADGTARYRAIYAELCGSNA